MLVIGLPYFNCIILFLNFQLYHSYFNFNYMFLYEIMDRARTEFEQSYGSIFNKEISRLYERFFGRIESKTSYTGNHAFHIGSHTFHSRKAITRIIKKVRHRRKTEKMQRGCKRWGWREVLGKKRKREKEKKKGDFPLGERVFFLRIWEERREKEEQGI